MKFMIMPITVEVGRKDYGRVLNVFVRLILRIGFVTAGGCRIQGGGMERGMGRVRIDCWLIWV